MEKQMPGATAGGDADAVEKYVMSLDVGTSNIRCYVYNRKAEKMGWSVQPIKILYPDSHGVEIDPDQLWCQVTDVIKGALASAKTTAENIVSIGISVQRNTFMLWDADTGEPFHNFLVWQDARAEYIEKSWNESYMMKMVRAGGKLAHGVSRQKRFMALHVLKFRTNQVSIRILWLMEKYPELRRLAKQGKVRFGNLDTWIIWKMTKGKTYATEMSCASSTGLYDPYIRQWSGFFMTLLSIPIQMLPPVWDTDADFGKCDLEHFGAEIPIRAAMGDQQSAMFGQCCAQTGHVKLTMGTGTFMDVNIGLKPHTSVEGFYPITAWKRGADIVHLAEGSCNTAGDAIEWLISLLSLEGPEVTESLAESVMNSDGVYFVPAFNGLQAPDNDFSACASLIGLKSTSSKAHITRAVLESLSFKNAEMYKAMTSEISEPIKRVVCDGGVTANNFVMQLTADLIGKQITRMQQSDMSALGAAFMAGRAVGFWKDDKTLEGLIKVERTFDPDYERAQSYIPVIEQWRNAVTRSMKWYNCS